MGKEERPLRTFIVKDGVHSDDTGIHYPGQAFQTRDDLSRFPEKFALVNELTGLPEGIAPAVVSNPVTEPEKSEPEKSGLSSGSRTSSSSRSGR